MPAPCPLPPAPHSTPLCLDAPPDRRADTTNAKRKREAPSSLPPLASEEVPDGSKRGIDYSMQKNRGLTPRRNKDLKNPRKRNRLKYGKAVTRRKGQVQDQRERRDAYGGETTGIKSKVSKSRKL